MTILADRLPPMTARAMRRAYLETRAPARPSCDVCGSERDGIRPVSEVADLIPPAVGYRPPRARLDGPERVRGAWITKLCDGCASRLRVRGIDRAGYEDDVQPRRLRRGRRA